MLVGVLLVALLAGGAAGSAWSVQGAQQLPFGLPASLSVARSPPLCPPAPPAVRVTGPRGQPVPAQLGACREGRYPLSFRPCQQGTIDERDKRRCFFSSMFLSFSSGLHVAAVLNEAGEQIAALTVAVLPQPKVIAEEAGPATQVVFEFDGLVPERH